MLAVLPSVVVSHTDGRSLLARLDLDGLADSFSFPGGTRILSRYPGGSFAVKLEGRVNFNDAEDDVQTLTGTLVVREREGGLACEMKLTSAGEGRIRRDYRVGGEPATLDNAGRRWWARAAQRMAETLIDPDVRAQKRFAQGGFDAVLADVEKATDDFTRRRRIEATLRRQSPVPVAVQDRLIAATAGLQGAFERREALSAIARQPLAEVQQLAWLAAVAGIDGDFERREALGVLAPRLLLRPVVLAAWSEALGRIGGDF